MVPKFLENAKKLGWLVISLDELIKKQYILDHLDGNHGNLYPRQEEFIDEGVKYISANSIVNGVIDFKKSKFLSQERADKFKKGVAKNGDVIFAHNATVGPVALLETNDEKVILSTSLTYYRVNSEKINGKYLVQYMSSPNFIRQYEAIMRQTTRNQLPITTQRDFLFIIPPIQEQKKIAEILSTWDKAIETVEKLVANSQQQKKALMQQLLTGEIRFFGKNSQFAIPKGVLQKKLGLLPIDWKVEHIKNHIWFQEGPGVRNSQFKESGIKLFNGTNIQFNRINLQNTNTYISENEGMGAYRHFLVDDGDLLIACSGISVNRFDEKIAFVNESHLPLCMNTSTMRFKQLENGLVNMRYFYYFMQTWLFKNQIRGQATGSAQLNFGPSHIANCFVAFPNIEEQEKIAQVLTLADREIDLYQQQLDKLKLEKKSLMQQLLTGQKRVIID